MTWLSDGAVARLRAAGGAPDLSGTKYRLLEGVARGGMGAVYLAEDVQLGRRVALKVLDLPDPGGALTRRLMQEARVLARLEHPGIVPVHDVGALADGRVFYAMKFVEGLRLDQHLARMASLPERLRLFGKICEAVAFAHARGILHRDLKPENIMVGPFGEVLVMDWGLAKILGETQDLRSPATQISEAPPAPMLSGGRATREESTASTGADAAETAHGAVLGTPGYMAPEQARGEVSRLDQRTDIYSLGAVFYFLLAGRAQVKGRPQILRGVPRPLAAIYAKAMSPEPVNRYASVEELATDLARFLDGLPVAAYPEGLLRKGARLLARHRVAVLLILTYLLIRALVLVVFRR
jgi:serine/threonine protein kinase